jgi:hypothetical protein
MTSAGRPGASGFDHRGGDLLGRLTGKELRPVDGAIRLGRTRCGVDPGGGVEYEQFR